PPTNTVTGVPDVAAGKTSLRSRFTRLCVASACGEDFGYTAHRALWGAGVDTGCPTNATLGSAATLAATGAIAVAGSSPSAVATSSSGPVNPGPKPSLRRACACLVVNDVGSLPASGKPKCM